MRRVYWQGLDLRSGRAPRTYTVTVRPSPANQDADVMRLERETVALFVCLSAIALLTVLL